MCDLRSANLDRAREVYNINIICSMPNDLGGCTEAEKVNKFLILYIYCGICVEIKNKLYFVATYCVLHDLSYNGAENEYNI